MISIDGKSLNCLKIQQIAHGEPVVLCQQAAQQMLRNTQQADNDRTVLERKNRWLIGGNLPESPDLTRAFILGHCAGVGDSLPSPIVRGAMAARANVLATACTGSRPIAAKKLLELLNRQIHPRVPAQGSVGAAGDLAPMAHIAYTLCGYGRPIANYDPLQPTAKEALSLINGVSLSAAIAAIASFRARRVLDASIIAAALTMEAVCAQSQCLDPRAVSARGHRNGETVANTLRTLLQGSQRVQPNRRPDAFSIRSGPSVLASITTNLIHLEQEIENELNGCSDNPLLFAGEWVESGNFHGANIATSMDHLKIILCQLATLSERRTFRLTHGKLSKNLPSFLVRGTGLNSGFMLAQYTAAALASECKGLSHPASVDTIPTVQHHEDHVSMAPIAGRMALKMLECVADIVAIELLLAAQAIDLRLRDDQLPLPPKLATIHQKIRTKVDFWEDDHVLHPAISALSAGVRNGDFSDSRLPW